MCYLIVVSVARAALFISILRRPACSSFVPMLDVCCAVCHSVRNTVFFVVRFQLLSLLCILWCDVSSCTNFQAARKLPKTTEAEKEV